MLILESGLAGVFKREDNSQHILSPTDRVKS